MDNNTQKKGYIPCYPSNPLINKEEEVQFIMMDDIMEYSNTYIDTIDFLKEINNKSDKTIPCLPIIKVFEDELITGIITETNQYIPLLNPEMDTFNDDLIRINSVNRIDGEVKSILSNEKDKERVEKIKDIQLEYEFFNAFRNTIRILLSKEKFRETKDKIQNLISQNIPYLNKLKKLKSILKHFTKEYVDFYEYDKEIIYNLVNITSCYHNNNCKETNFCLFKKNICNLLIPKINLINNELNEEIYFNRIADELIRHNRIKSFIFKPKTFLAFPDTKYSLNDDEIILLHIEIINKPGYFDKLNPVQNNKYVKTYTYDTASPNKTISYSNVFNLDKKNIQLYEVIKVSKYLSEYFKDDHKEIVFSTVPSISSFGIIQFILNNEEINISLEELKNKLVSNYNMYYEGYEDTILNILYNEKKETFIKEIRKNQLKINDMIMTTEYNLTFLDILLLLDSYNIPCIYYYRDKFEINNKKIIVTNLSQTGKYYFINTTNIVNNNTISLVGKDISDIKVSINNVSEKLATDIRDLDYHLSIEDYIKNYSIIGKSIPVSTISERTSIPIPNQQMLLKRKRKDKSKINPRIEPLEKVKEKKKRVSRTDIISKDEFNARLEENIKIEFNQDNPKTRLEGKKETESYSDYEKYKKSKTIKEYVDNHPNKDKVFIDYQFALNPAKHIQFKKRKENDGKPEEAWVLREY